MTDRTKICEECEISQPLSNFKRAAIAGHGHAKEDVVEDVCLECKRFEKERRETRERSSMRGVDIDAIHYKLGKVKTKRAA